ncbi:amino acid permease [Nicoliella spurrieriana]|uniref:Amino acid permease n=1 Tax=Nicoliella spurrieriana TaxID=2925830 RepID=A0A976RRE0_9LACO|nr:amino acid permease [Nicoliella spurrieriana]UQS86394.1 amino acid permease [Nicoliella spurrieriana]
MEELKVKSDVNKSGIGPFAAFATVMGTVIGGGVFFKTASVVASTYSFGLTILVWIVSGLLTICAGLTVSELAAALPETGGPVKFLELGYGKLTGFLFGWAQSLVYTPGNVAGLCLVFGTQFVNLFHLSSGMNLMVAILCGLTILVINLLGSQLAGRVQSIALIIKLIPILIIAIVGLFIPGQVHVQLWPFTPINHANVWSAFGQGLLATMFAYDGWIGISNIAGELKNPKSDLPKAIIIGLSLVTIIYTLINFVFLKNMPINAIAGNQNTASQVASHLFGAYGGKLVTIGILVSVYGAINGYLFTGIQIPRVLGSENMIPFSKHFAKVSKNGAPYVAAIFQFVVAVLMMCSGSFDILTDMSMFIVWSFFCLLFVEVIMLRKKRPDLSRPYKVPGYPIVPLLALVGALFVLIVTIFTQTGLVIAGVILTAIGVPVYYLHQRQINK